MSDGGLQPEALSGAMLEQALAAARAEAEAVGIAVCVAVVDAAGAPAAFLRLPGAFLVSSDLAVDKAWSAVSFSQSTRDLRAMLKSVSDDLRQGLLRRPRVTDVPGGLPITIDGVKLGGIGVSGGSEEEDEQIARAALDRLCGLGAAE